MESPVNLSFLPANNAWAFVLGSKLFRVERDELLLFSTRDEAVRVAQRNALFVKPNGEVLTRRAAIEQGLMQEGA